MGRHDKGMSVHGGGEACVLVLHLDSFKEKINETPKKMGAC